MGEIGKYCRFFLVEKTVESITAGEGVYYNIRPSNNVTTYCHFLWVGPSAHPRCYRGLEKDLGQKVKSLHS